VQVVRLWVLFQPLDLVPLYWVVPMCSLQLSNLESWYVVHYQPLKERQADATLAHYLGLITYLSAIRRRFRGRVQQAPLFPPYLFVRANLHVVALSAINATPGVLRMVAFDDRPEPVSAALIEALRRGKSVRHYDSTARSARLNFPVLPPLAPLAVKALSSGVVEKCKVERDPFGCLLRIVS
jgi:transcription antitermination factor NusG